METELVENVVWNQIESILAVCGMPAKKTQTGDPGANERSGRWTRSQERQVLAWGQKKKKKQEGWRTQATIYQNWRARTSLVVQWLRIHGPMQGTWFWFLVWEDPTCHSATMPLNHNYWACALQREATAMRGPHITTESSLCSPQWEKARAKQQRPTIAKINKLINHF